ncbi:MAG: 16S rRNA (guanine(527)-N(7))-methyltransferase, partial [uncultured Thermomicrobiales bacterium]
VGRTNAGRGRRRGGGPRAVVAGRGIRVHRCRPFPGATRPIHEVPAAPLGLERSVQPDGGHRPDRGRTPLVLGRPADGAGPGRRDPAVGIRCGFDRAGGCRQRGGVSGSRLEDRPARAASDADRGDREEGGVPPVGHRGPPTGRGGRRPRARRGHRPRSRLPGAFRDGHRPRGGRPAGPAGAVRAAAPGRRACPAPERDRSRRRVESRAPRRAGARGADRRGRRAAWVRHAPGDRYQDGGHARALPAPPRDSGERTARWHAGRSGGSAM